MLSRGEPMPDHQDSPSRPLAPSEEPEWTGSDIDAAISGLDLATRDLSRKVEALTDRAAAHQALGRPMRAERSAAFEGPMQAAEREAHEYLERAKRRVESLVNTMLGAVEREAAEIGRATEAGIRERWEAVEHEAGIYLDDARRVSEGMVAEQQQRLGSLSEGITQRAEALTAGMEDAERIRHQFDDFVRALSQTARQIAEPESSPVQAEAGAAQLAGRPDALPGDALAA
jgi:hypothetical protein